MENEDINIVPENWNFAQGAVIKVIGVGGSGGNALNYMYNLGINGVDYVVCNTDGQDLKKSCVKNKVQLGEKETGGRGAGCNPEVGKRAAEESKDKIHALLSDGTEMVFITAGMGGGTGTGAAPVIAKEAKEMGILTVAIVTLPFSDEGAEPTMRAIEGLKALKDSVDSLLIISNDKLYEIYGKLKLREGFQKANEILATAVKGIAEIITKPGFINVDFADVKKVMKNSGVSLMGTGFGEGDKRARQAVEAALTSPLLNNNSIKGATNILVNISVSETEDLDFSELGEIMNYIQKEAGSVKNMKRGVVYDESLGGKVVVTIVATGFKIKDIPELTFSSEILDNEQNVNNDNVERVNLDNISDNTQSQINFTPENNNDELQVHEVETNETAENTTDSETNGDSKTKLTGLNKQQIQYFEIPAYKRKHVKLDADKQYSEQNNETHETLEENENGEIVLKSKNSFLNPNVD